MTHLCAAEPIRIGVLHSLTGTMSESEKPLVDAVTLAVEQINRDGGLLGRHVEIVLADGRSDSKTFAEEARKLLEEKKVSAIFGCWTSASRKAVKPIVEAANSVLFYPVQYEGLESSPNIVYTGSVANQQIIPGTRWAIKNFGRRVYLVGSDYVFPRTANMIIKDVVSFSKAKVVGERYLPLGSTELKAVIEDIKKQRPDVVLNTINGDTNRYFFDALLAAHMELTRVVSFSVAENEMRAYGGDRLSQHYAVWNYFQSLDTPQNRKFIKEFKDRFGQDRAIDDPMEASYVGVVLWSRAVVDAKDDSAKAVNAEIVHQSVSAPSGISSVEPFNRHLYKHARVGKVRAGGQFDIVYDLGLTLKPSPYPVYRGEMFWREAAKTVLESIAK